MLTHFPKTVRTRWFEKIRRRLPHCPERIQVPTKGVGPGGVGKAQSANASSTVLRLSLVTCNQVNFLRNHNGTKSENKLLGDAFLLGVDVADM